MSREVMQQALEAIEPVMAYGRPGTRDVEQAVLQKAHTALRAALAEQAEQVAVPAGHALVPVEPTTAMLRPFYACPPEELELAWQALLIVAKNTAAPPAPARQPLTEEQIAKAADAIDDEAAFSAGFYEGARFAERAHGIK